MIYLVGQIFLIIWVAAFIGLILGWWSRGLTETAQETVLPMPSDTELDPFGARTRLEQCHRDNASLRRELHDVQQQLVQWKQADELAQRGDVLEQLQQNEARINALMDDLQERDDTIAILKQELDRLRS
ncbi:MAG: hypothetical protein CR991_07610 [Proteobacteria bacterium]|nr:MAG: hypothetical protein CR991_07610 [Pseudomonadota bacterium]